MKKIKQPILLFTVFFTGACILIIEVVAIRILSPFFGNTIFNYSSVITVILAALSAGYYLGGKLADRRPNPGLFYGIILGSGVSVLVLQLINILFLSAISDGLSLMLGPLVCAFILFFLPAFLLGMLSPFAIKLLNVDAPQEGVGSISGKVFFWSTTGSILGSLTAGFLLIPWWGINKIVVSIGMAIIFLGLGGIMIFRKKRRFSTAATILAILISLLLFNLFSSEALTKKASNLFYERDGIYEKIAIYVLKKHGEPRKPFFGLFQDRSPSGWMYLDSDEHVTDYTKYYALYKIFNPAPEDILVIGGGAYTIPKSYYRDLPNAAIDVAEIEPRLFNLARDYFRLPPDPRIRNHVADGRRFLKDSKVKYDVIFADAYYSFASIPHHLATAEFFRLAKDKLQEGGVFIANIYGDLDPKPQSLIYAEMKTFNSVFQNHYYFAVKSPHSGALQNIIFVGLNDDRRIDFKELKKDRYGDEIIASLPKKLIDDSKIDLSSHPVFTDDYAPVEYFSIFNIKRKLDRFHVYAAE